MSAIAVPGFPGIEVSVSNHGDDDSTGRVWVWIRYDGWREDLIAAGIVTTQLLEPTGKRLRRDAQGDPVSIKQRSWRLKDGSPQQYCTVLRFKGIVQLDTLPGARDAVSEHIRMRNDYLRQRTEGHTVGEWERQWNWEEATSLRELSRAAMPSTLKQLITDLKGQS